MAIKVKVEMLEDGRWSDVPRDPIMELKKGDVIEFTLGTAKTAIKAGKAKYYAEPEEPEEEPEKEPEGLTPEEIAAALGSSTPDVVDKAKAEKKRGRPPKVK